MKERPIIMTGDSPTQIIEGRKVQTRRVIKDPEYYGCPTGDCPHDKQSECNAAMQTILKDFPELKVGNRLWVQEAFVSGHPVDMDGINREIDKIWYKSDGKIKRWHYCDGEFGPVPWHYASEMTRAASRILLEITVVRVEQLQAISIEEIRKEAPSVVSLDDPKRTLSNEEVSDAFLPYAFKDEWNIRNRPGQSWASNPWVWVIDFKRLEPK